MPLRTLHKDSCLDLKALAGHNNANNTGFSNKDKNSLDDANMIDLDMFSKDADEASETPSRTETDSSSNDSNEDINDCSMNGMNERGKSSRDENDLQSITGKNKKLMSMLFAWRKNKENTSSEGTECLDQDDTFIEEKKVSEDQPSDSPSFLSDVPNNPNRNLKRTFSPVCDEQTNSLSQENSYMIQKSIMKKKKHNVRKHVTFSTTARLITIYPHKDLPPTLKRQIWWQRTDYKNFKKTIDIISRELLQHVSDDVWFLGAQDQRFVAPTERSEENQFGAKWWCQYGHSRRGLEHICSMAEGRYRQQNVERATTCTLIEQERQNLSERPDSRKLAMAAFRFTSFARDLARAVGKADAEAVRVNFEASKMKDFRHFMPSKYEKGFLDWDSSLSREGLSPDTARDVFSARIDSLEDDPSSELDSFCDNQSLP